MNFGHYPTQLLNHQSIRFPLISGIGALVFITYMIIVSYRMIDEDAKSMTSYVQNCTTYKVSYLSSGYRIYGWVMRPVGDGPYPVVVYNHGSRVGRSGHANLDQPTLSITTKPWPGVASGKCAVFFPEGRGYAGSDGPSLNDCGSLDDVLAYLNGRADDVLAGIDWLSGQGWADNTRIAITGCSHGAVVTLFAAVSGLFGSVIAQAPGVSIAHPSTGLEQMTSAISKTAATILLQHAVDDMHCPIETSRSLYAAGRRAGRKIALREYPSVRGVDGHAQFNFNNRAIWALDFDQALAPIIGLSPLLSVLW